MWAARRSSSLGEIFSRWASSLSRVASVRVSGVWRSAPSRSTHFTNWVFWRESFTRSRRNATSSPGGGFIARDVGGESRRRQRSVVGSDTPIRFRLLRGGRRNRRRNGDFPCHGRMVRAEVGGVDFKRSRPRGVRRQVLGLPWVVRVRGFHRVKKYVVVDPFHRVAGRNGEFRGTEKHALDVDDVTGNSGLGGFGGHTDQNGEKRRRRNGSGAHENNFPSGKSHE